MEATKPQDAVSVYQNGGKITPNIGAMGNVFILSTTVLSQKVDFDQPVILIQKLETILRFLQKLVA